MLRKTLSSYALVTVLAGAILLAACKNSASATPKKQDRAVAAIKAGSRTLNWAGRSWIVRGEPSLNGPGPNLWSDSYENVWVDYQGQLHLRITQHAGQWYCPEVFTADPVGYGEFNFYTASRVDKLDPNVVLGMFVYRDDSHEIDIEISRWGNPKNMNSQFALQPGWLPWNVARFDTLLNGDYATFRLGWQPGGLSFEALHGHQSGPAPKDQVIATWKHTGGGRPVPTDKEHAHLNLWLKDGVAPFDGREPEVIFANFTYRP